VTAPSGRAAASPRVLPRTAPQIADAAVAFVERKFGFRLPYTPESLIVVEAIVDKVRETGAAEHEAFGVLSGLGCYVGEVLVRHARASWRSATEMKMSTSCRFSAVLALPGPAGCDPIGCVFQRFGSGTTSLARLYEAAVAAPR
jgi:hypothetical protein